MERSLEETIKTLSKAKKELSKVSMKELIEGHTGTEVLSFDKTKHRELLEEIKLICESILAKFENSGITREIYEDWRGKKVNAFRNNEVGNFCEWLVSQAYKHLEGGPKTIEKVTLMSSSGYPDLLFETKFGKVFVEIKATSRPNKGSPRDFYYSISKSTLKKVSSDGLHLLIGFVAQQGDGKFNLVGFKIVDISRITVKLKLEFNTDNLGIYSKETTLYSK